MFISHRRPLALLLTIESPLMVLATVFVDLEYLGSMRALVRFSAELEPDLLAAPAPRRRLDALQTRACASADRKHFVECLAENPRCGRLIVRLDDAVRRFGHRRKTQRFAEVVARHILAMEEIDPDWLLRETEGGDVLWVREGLDEKPPVKTLRTGALLLRASWNP